MDTSTKKRTAAAVAGSTTTTSAAHRRRIGRPEEGPEEALRVDQDDARSRGKKAQRGVGVNLPRRWCRPTQSIRTGRPGAESRRRGVSVDYAVRSICANFLVFVR